MEDGVLPTYITGTLRSPGAEMGVTNDDRADSSYTAYITSYPDQGDYFKVSVAGTTATAHTALIAEADMRIASCLTTGSALQIALEDVYMISANVTADGTISFSELTATSGEDRYTTSLNAKAKVGEWFKLRIEYYVGDADSVRIKVFLRGYRTVQDEKTTLKLPNNQSTVEECYANNYDHFTYETDLDNKLIIIPQKIEVLRKYYQSFGTPEKMLEGYRTEVSDHVPIRLKIDFLK